MLQALHSLDVEKKCAAAAEEERHRAAAAAEAAEAQRQRDAEAAAAKKAQEEAAAVKQKVRVTGCFFVIWRSVLSRRRSDTCDGRLRKLLPLKKRK